MKNHSYAWRKNSIVVEVNNIHKYKYMFLSRFHEALDLCKLAGSNSDWAELGKACLVHMEVELAIQVYRMSGNVAMVLSLQGIQVQNTHKPQFRETLSQSMLTVLIYSPSPSLSVQGREDMNLRAGHLAMFLGDYNLAQDLYLSSSYPIAALEVKTYTQLKSKQSVYASVSVCKRPRPTTCVFYQM